MVESSPKYSQNPSFKVCSPSLFSNKALESIVPTRYVISCETSTSRSLYLLFMRTIGFFSCEVQKEVNGWRGLSISGRAVMKCYWLWLLMEALSLSFTQGESFTFTITSPTAMTCLKRLFFTPKTTCLLKMIFNGCAVCVMHCPFVLLLHGLTGLSVFYFEMLCNPWHILWSQLNF